jgi:hypothetical protein
MINSMELTDEQNTQLRSVLDAVITDTIYTLLLGLDGSATIGDNQHLYKIYDENDQLISDGGNLEAEAWSQFHGNT